MFSSSRITSLALVALGCLASLTIECTRRGLTETERHGQEAYERTCAVCHGHNGEGYAADKAPALGNAAFLASVTDESLRATIVSGRIGTTMSAWSTAWGGPLAIADVDAVIAFIRHWSRAPRAVLDERPLAGDAIRGATTYGQRCASCHGQDGITGPNVHIGDRGWLALTSNGFLRYAISGGRPGTAMPGFGDALGNGGVEDLVALLRSWQTAPPSLTLSPTPAPPTAPIPLGPVPLNPKGPEPIGFRAQPEVTPADVVKGQLDRGARMAVLDARAPSDYVGGHIAGAVSVPFYDPSPYIAGLPKNAWLVCYCACPHAESGQLAQTLVGAGFTKVTVLDEGLGVWRARKYPTHTGEAP